MVPQNKYAPDNILEFRFPIFNDSFHLCTHTHTHPIPGKSVLPEKSRETEENTEDGSQRRENARNSTAITKGVRGDESGQLWRAFHFRGMPWETNDKKSINPERTHHHHLLTAKKEGPNTHLACHPSSLTMTSNTARPVCTTGGGEN